MIYQNKHKRKYMNSNLKALKAQLENLFEVMPTNHFELNQRNKAAFLISREIEKLENPKGYNENKNHWQGHELRF